MDFSLWPRSAELRFGAIKVHCRQLGTWKFKPETYYSGMPNETVLKLDLPGIKKVKSGKVREIFDLGDRLLLVASDRISAFDVIMPNGIPRKGEVLTQISHFWFEKFALLVPNHLLAKANDPLPANLQP